MNLSETLTKKKRKKLLKQIFDFINGMSYSNSLFTAFLNLLSERPGYPNYKFSLKIFFILFLIRVGLILSCASLIPYCDCTNDKHDTGGMVLSIIGILIGILMTFCPILLGIGFYFI